MPQADNLKSNFLRYLLAANRPQMDDFKEWLLQPGMLFNSREQWWGGRGTRAAPHEGLDLHSFADARGMIKKLNRQIKIPAAFAGHIVKICPDFLGQSIFIRHVFQSPGGRRLYSAYGHTAPLDSLSVGQEVVEGEIIGAISGGSGNRTALAPHLHITFAWAPADCSPERLTWKNLGDDAGITLIDPLTVISSHI